MKYIVLDYPKTLPPIASRKKGDQQIQVKKLPTTSHNLAFAMGTTLLQ